MGHFKLFLLVGMACANMRVAVADSPQTPAQPNAVFFDADILKQRGLSVDIGNYFAHAPRFKPGPQIITIMLNGLDVGRYPAVFDANGKLCMTARLAAQIGLSIPPEPVPAETLCPAATVNIARLQIELQPSLLSVEITAPPEYTPTVRLADKALHGGLGAMLNYRGFALNTRSDSAGATDYRYLETEWGFNADDWVARSRQYFTQNDGTRSLRWTSAYAQKTFLGPDKIFQAGRISTVNPLYMGLPLTGAQWFPEAGLRQERRFPIEGIAFGRSRLEIRQNGILLYTTFVPGGAFTLTDYPVQTTSADLELRVIDENGLERNILVPSTSLLLGGHNDEAAGFSAAGGRLWSQAGSANYEARQLALTSYSFQWTPRISNTVAALYAQSYRSAGASAQWRASAGATFFGQVLGAEDGRHEVRGVIASGAASFSAGFMDLGLTASVRSRDYRTLMEAVNLSIGAYPYQGVRSQAGVNVSITDGWAQGLSLGVTRQDYFSGNPNHVYSLGWGGTFSRASLQLGISRNASKALAVPGAGTTPASSGTYAYVNLSFPLGAGVRSNSYLRSNASMQYAGTSIDQSLGDTLSYRATVERQSDDRGTDSNNTALSASVNARYASLTLGASHGAQSSSRYGELIGSVVAAAEGLAFAPFAAQDSYGVARLGNIAGIRIDTPQGAVWSGPAGLAALPGLAAFRSSRLEVASRSVPLDVDIDNGLAVVTAARGAVVSVDMGAHRVRRALLTIQDRDGALLPYGLGVLSNGEFATSVGSKGRILVNLDDEPVVWKVLLPDGGSCTLSDIRTTPKQPSDLFERGSAVCKEP